MATHKKFFMVKMIIVESALYDLMMLADGNAVKGSLDVQPVKHGGQDDNGRLRAHPSGRDFVLAYMATTSQLVMRDAAVAAAEQGISKASVYTSISTLIKEKVLKRIGVGTYVLTSKQRAKKAAKITQGVKAKKTATAAKKSAGKRPRGEFGKPAEGTIRHTILNTMRRLQNGSGEGVTVPEIRTALGGTDYAQNNISACLSSLMKQKLVTRVAEGHYRAKAEQASAEG